MLPDPGRSFAEARQCTIEKCDSCGACVRTCPFLAAHGSPAELAESMRPEEPESLLPAFSCSLCGLCSVLCPKDADPAALFFLARGRAAKSGHKPAPGHERWLSYEDRGKSERYSLFAVPRDSDRVFFPGCSLSGKRPDAVKSLYASLARSLPGLGVVLSCCCRPSRDLGRFERFFSGFEALNGELGRRGVKEVITACPGCLQVLSRHGDFAVRSAYELLAENGGQEGRALAGEVTIHDPCVGRHFPGLHDSVRELVARSGLMVSEMPSNREKTLCCGEGGCVAALSPRLSREMAGKRQKQAGQRPVVTYCSGCINMLGGPEKALHVLDLVFRPERALAGKIPSPGAPITYINRLLLKRHFRKALPD